LTEAAALQVEVVFAQLDTPLTYLVPNHLSPLIKPLTRVLAPLRQRQVLGFCLDFPQARNLESGFDLKSISDVMDDITCLPPSLMGFFERAAAYYQTPLGKFLVQCLPAGLGKIGNQDARVVKYHSLVQLQGQAPSDLPTPMQTIVTILQTHGDLSAGQLKKLFPRAAYWLPRMEKQGLIRISKHPFIRDISGNAIMPPPPPPQLTEAQAQAVNAINSALDREKFQSFMLYGVTGSGKTEVYLRAIEYALGKGKTALMLEPEIGLTLRMQGILQERLGAGQVAVLHSGLTPTQRRQQWLALASGRAQVALGARSAVFAPLPNLGVIGVDEEQDEAYKQEDRVRYNGRDMALLRGQEQGCPVVLGSATPALTTYFRARQGKHALLSLPERVRALPAPRMELIDLRVQPRLLGGFLSPALHQALQDNYQAGEQSLLFLNRRGFAPSIICRQCGARISCPACSLSLTWHQQRGRLLCHLCGREQGLPSQCPECQAPAEFLKPLGWGTEAVEKKLRELHPEWRLARLDRDSAAAPADLSAILRQMLNNEVDVLIGTQMLGKGHHFPNLTLVGILAADQSLNQPDYRASERTYILLTQVAGRAGRESRPGRVLVQTYNPYHHAVQAALTHDESSFYEQELRERQGLGYPPFGRLVSLRVESLREEKAAAAATDLGRTLEQSAQKLRIKARIIGPAPSPIAKAQNLWRFLLLIKAANSAQAARLLRLGLYRLGALPNGVYLQVDIDPLQLI
jgi:primosomal protein N' (replication factor Y)